MSGPRVELPPALAAIIGDEVRRAGRRECCGLLEGARSGDFFAVRGVHPARNLSDDPDRFEIDPRDHIAAVKKARANGAAIIGCYHSHPHGSAQPSAHDLAGAGEDDFLWVIAAAQTLAAFVYSRGSFCGADWVTSSG